MYLRCLSGDASALVELCCRHLFIPEGSEQDLPESLHTLIKFFSGTASLALLRRCWSKAVVHNLPTVRQISHRLMAIN